MGATPAFPERSDRRRRDDAVYADYPQVWCSSSPALAVGFVEC
jgi:hypothetical protein